MKISVKKEELYIIAYKLAEYAIKRKTLTYGELSKEVHNRVSPIELAKPLGDLSRLAHEHGFPMISALAYNQEESMPGKGFFGVYSDLYFKGRTLSEDERMNLWAKEVEKVFSESKDRWSTFLKIIEENNYIEEIK